MALNEAQYKSVFDLHYEALYGYACSILGSEVYAEDILQNIFIKLWQSRSSVIFNTVKSYLYTSVRNECLNQLKHKKVQAAYANTTLIVSDTSGEAHSPESKELHEKIHHLLNELPEKCATVFYMCRQLGLSYKEVAQELNISIKTVENHMSKALKLLRGGLAAYLISIIPLMFLSLINL